MDFNVSRIPSFDCKNDYLTVNGEGEFETLIRVKVNWIDRIWMCLSSLWNPHFSVMGKVIQFIIKRSLITDPEEVYSIKENLNFLAKKIVKYKNNHKRIKKVADLALEKIKKIDFDEIIKKDYLDLIKDDKMDELEKTAKENARKGESVGQCLLLEDKHLPDNEKGIFVKQLCQRAEQKENVFLLLNFINNENAVEYTKKLVGVKGFSEKLFKVKELDEKEHIYNHFKKRETALKIFIEGLERAAKYEKDCFAMLLLADHYIQEEMSDKRAAWLKKAAEKGNLKAIATFLLEKEKVSEADCQKYKKFIKAAIQKKNPEDLYYASIYYQALCPNKLEFSDSYEGLVDSQQFKNLQFCLEKAASLGHGLAMVSLAKLHFNFLKDTKKALEWAKEAALRGFEDGLDFYKDIFKEETSKEEVQKLQNAFQTKQNLIKMKKIVNLIYC